ncbi:MAG TPA: shikimate kinase [Dehalococcoidia bacterium]|nr:shikimate kinase [Dehalococcoidia bacterium]
MPDDRIWLTGFMATGKSRVARALAAALDWAAVDIDTMVTERAGEPVRAIFARGGEAAFRALEAEAVQQAAALERVVIATGGGTVLAEANRARMRQRGFVVCLDARPETIAARIAQSGEHISERPLLAGGDPLARIRELKAQRQPLYDEADLVIETDELTPDEVTHRIVQAYRERAAAKAAQ